MVSSSLLTVAVHVFVEWLNCNINVVGLFWLGVGVTAAVAAVAVIATGTLLSTILEQLSSSRLFIVHSLD